MERKVVERQMVSPGADSFENQRRDAFPDFVTRDEAWSAPNGSSQWSFSLLGADFYQLFLSVSPLEAHLLRSATLEELYTCIDCRASSSTLARSRAFHSREWRSSVDGNRRRCLAREFVRGGDRFGGTRAASSIFASNDGSSRCPGLDRR